MFLLLCLPQYLYATKLVHLDLRGTKSDRSFYEALHAQYWETRGRYVSFFSCKTLRRIHFVQFEVYRNDLADIIKINDIPPPEKHQDYHYTPMPAKRVPPVGENIMMHWYENPSHADDDTPSLNKMPKKLRDRLAIKSHQDTEIGWGIYFVEGSSWLCLFCSGLVGLLLGGLFGALWAHFKDDVQGGFAVAAFVLMAFSFIIGILQALLG